MIRLNRSEEELLKIIKGKYEKYNLENYEIDFSYGEFPVYISQNIKDLSDELKRGGYIARIIASLSGINYVLTPSLLSYFDDKSKLETEKQRSFGSTYNVGTINADSSNLVLGDVINSTLNIDDSINKLYEQIESDGGEEKEELKKLMAEVEDVINEIKIRGVLPKQNGLKERLSNHLEKNGWFYGSVVSLIGAAVLQFVG